MNQPWIYMCSPSQSPLLTPSPSHPPGSSQCTSPEHLSHASSLGWWSVSPLIIYLFQCYSLRSSHPRLLPQSPKVCSIHQCLFFCLIFSSESALRFRWPKYRSFSFSISPSNEHPGLISLGWTGWISLQSKGLQRVSSNMAVQKHQFFCTQLSL